MGRMTQCLNTIHKNTTGDRSGLRAHDYSLAGAYLVTICVENGRCLLGHINNDEMVLNEFGRSVNEVWQNTIRRRDNVELDEYVVMSNHFHTIVWLTNAPELRATHASPLQWVISVRNRADRSRAESTRLGRTAFATAGKGRLVDGSRADRSRLEVCSYVG